MIEAGTVVAVRKGQALVKVLILGRTTEWLPVLQQANSFRRKFTPVRCGEQVVVLANRYVVGAIFNKDCSEPEGANEHCDVIEYEDGTRISYDTKAKHLQVKAAGSIDIVADGDISIEAKTKMAFKAKRIDLN